MNVFQIMSLHGVMLRKFVSVTCGGCLAPVTHVARQIFSGEKLNMASLNTDLTGVFVHKVGVSSLININCIN